MTASAEPDVLTRFARAERLVHRATALLMTGCIVTGFVLYYGPMTLLVGHRRVVELVHVWCGFALPLPMLLGAASAAYRADLGRLNRFSPTDWRWLRNRGRRDASIRVDKFNAGQKLNACLTAGSILVLLGTGTLLFFPDLVRLSWRTGATFVHDWFALGLGLLVLGHVWFAISEPDARAGMRTGQVSRSYARLHHAAWLAEVDATEAHTSDERSDTA